MGTEKATLHGQDLLDTIPYTSRIYCERVLQDPRIASTSCTCDEAVIEGIKHVYSLLRIAIIETDNLSAILHSI
jgi:hypothetical protein